MKRGLIKLSVPCILLMQQLFSYAQNKLPSCGWSLPETDEVSEIMRRQAENKIRQYILQNGAQDTDTLYTLPIVVHVIHTGTAIGSPDNPTDVQINAMIDGLNNAWRKLEAQSGGADMKIQFKLALRSPGCVSTTGINRVNGSGIANYVSGGIGINGFPGSADEIEIKNVSRWSNTDYINIWIVNKINGSAVNIGGYAYFAQYSNAAVDGIVMNAAFVNGTSKILSHEMGHVFELYHTFYDDGNQTNCPRIDSCGFYGDRVCDTEAGKSETVCTNAINVCTGNPYFIADPVKNYTVLHNYMNYTNCSWMFTQGQKLRVRATLMAFRPGLFTSEALKPPPSISAVMACIPSASFGQSPFYGIERVTFNTIDVYSNSSAGDRAIYVDRTCNQQTVVSKGQTYILRVIGSYANFHSIKAYIDYNADGDFADAGENIFTAYADTATVAIIIPSAGIQTGKPLRLRIVADNPAPGFPTYPSDCQLNGTLDEGSGQTEDYAIIIATGTIQSITSGNWNNPSTWNCNCVPTMLDNVIIKNSHSVTITQAMGLVECTQLTIETGGVLTVNNNGQLKQRK